MKTNVEAAANIRDLIIDTGDYLTLDASDLDIAAHCTALPGIAKSAIVENHDEEFGTIHGRVNCQALIATACVVEYVGQTISADSLMLRTNLSWQLPAMAGSAAEKHASRSFYALSIEDPAVIDDCFRHLRSTLPDEDVNNLRHEQIPRALHDITMSYQQDIPETSRLTPDQRKRIIRGFKSAFPYLTIISTSTAGNVHDDEIPLLSEWLVGQNDM